MELMDRDLQRRLLTKLAEAYPLHSQSVDLGFAQDDRAWIFNAQYLAEHALVEAVPVTMMDGRCFTPRARITARGLDFLQDDGGLTAILGTLTVRLDAETIRALIEEKIEASTELPPEDKSRLMHWVSTAGAEALKEATKRLVGAALDHAPQALQLLQRLPG